MMRFNMMDKGARSCTSTALRLLALTVLAGLFLIAGSGRALADTDVPCDATALKDAITAANTAGGGTLNLAQACTYSLASSAGFTDGASGLPSITAAIVINGNGATIQRSSMSNFRIFHVNTSGSLTLNQATVTGGSAGYQGGGGIYSRGVLELNDCTVTGNRTSNGTKDVSDGGPGGGIYSTGTLRLTRTVISNNSTGAGYNMSDWTYTYVGNGGKGGGIYTTGNAELVNSTVSGNTTGKGGDNPWCDNYEIDGGGGGAGGGIYNTGTLALTYSTVSGNTGGTGGKGWDGGPGADGGGVHSSGTLQLTNSTISGNAAGTGGNADTAHCNWNNMTGGAGGNGGGVFNSGTLTLRRSTLSDNAAAAAGTGKLAGTNGAGGGIYISGASAAATVTGAIIGNSGRGDCYRASGTVTDGGFNLVEDRSCSFPSGGDPVLGPLQDNGGATQTHMLQANSPAIDAGDPNYAPEPDETDQRGRPRISGGRIDIGAVEVDPVCWATKDSGTTVYGSEDASAVQVAVDAATAGGIVRAAGNCVGVQAAHGSTQTLYISKNVTVEGGYSLGAWTTPDPTEQHTILDAAFGGRVVRIPSGVNTTLRYLTISGGSTTSGSGIHNVGTLVLESSTVTNNIVPGDPANDALRGGGIYNTGTALVTASTIYSNSAAYAGGGFYNPSPGELTITNSTISGNSARWGGGISNWNGVLQIRFTTLVDNNATTGGAGIHNRQGSSLKLTATVIGAPQSGSNCYFESPNPATSGGYNRFSDASCPLAAPPVDRPDVQNAIIELGPLGYNGGATLNYLPRATSTNSVLDLVPQGICEQMLGANPTDQRGRTRPHLGFVDNQNYCDAGSIERSQEIFTVCGPPLDPDDSTQQARCQFLSIAAALEPASDDDIILVTGVVTENVTLTKDITVRGPRQADVTPGTHLGVIQGASAPSSSACVTGSSIFTIPAGRQITIEDLNIRHGCAEEGGAINNAGALTLRNVTLYDNIATRGGGIYNTGTLSAVNSTLATNQADGSGGALYCGGSGTANIKASTLADNTAASAGSSIWAAASPASVTLGATILDTPDAGVSHCQGAVSSLGYNLIHGAPGGDCQFSGSPDTNVYGQDPQLGVLRDNGGPTLTRAIPADSPAVDRGFPGDDAINCAVQIDQRGRARPFDVPNGLGMHCDIGAYEYGPRTLMVDRKLVADPNNGVFDDLQQALNRSLTGDVVLVAADTYTANFTAYRDVTIQHAGIDTAKLSPELGVDVRAILQASTRNVAEQHRLEDFAGTTLTVEGYVPSGGSIVPTGDISVTLSGLTIRHGAGSLGGGVYNRGALTIDACTIEGNAAINAAEGDESAGLGGGIYNSGQLTLSRSTLSGNRAERYGGALYSDGSAEAVTADVTASTLANNSAGLLPEQHVVAVQDGGLSRSSLSISSGDEVRFENQTGQAHTMSVQSPPTGLVCSPSSIEVPNMGAGLSVALVCTTDASVEAGAQRTVLVRDTDFGLTLELTVEAPPYTPGGAALYQIGRSVTTLDRSIVYSASAVRICTRPEDAAFAQVASLGTNLFGPETINGVAGQSTCSPLLSDLIADPKLGTLQDNNAIDYRTGTVSGYAHTHALSPASPAIDAIAPDVCQAATVHQIELGTSSGAALLTGDIVEWVSSIARTIVFSDGEYDERLVEVPAGRTPVRMQFTQAGSFTYRVYDAQTLAQSGAGTITVTDHVRLTDQRGLVMPQRGAALTYRCDIGAYEFETWVVGQPLPRPPSASGKEAPQWTVNGAQEQGGASGYHAWSPAARLDYPIRPTRLPISGPPTELAEVSWALGNALATAPRMTQIGIVVWPDRPQLHISGATVNLSHSDVTDGFAVSQGDARAFEGFEPQEELAGKIVNNNIFSRTELTAQAGDSYSVLQFLKGTQSSSDVKVLVVNTVAWDTPGIRDLRDREAADGYSLTDCVIGRELAYPAFTDAVGTLPGHADPEGRPGWILDGAAYDGVATAAELAVVSNTVDDLVPPAHVRELRQGPIIPVLAQAPAEGETDTRTADDLRVAWYRMDSRNVAWPVKSVAYRCRWPVDAQAPKIIIASELGSEIGGQAVLTSDRYVDATIYHQSDPAYPGHSPNYEHALLSASNLGNSAAALYALRTDLFNRNTNPSNLRSYALLKFRDARQANRTQMAAYRVLLTQEPAAITDYATDPGTISPMSAQAASEIAAQTTHAGGSPVVAAVPAAGALTLRVSDGVLAGNGTVTVPLDALSATGLRAAQVEVSYDPARLTPTRCAPNGLLVVERPADVTVEADQGVLAQRVIHMRARATAGTDLRYQWDFADGVVQYDDRQVSHVYSSPGTYHVTVKVSNGLFEDEVIGSADVEVVDTQTTPPTLLDTEPARSGCRMVAPGTLLLDLRTRDKHGANGNVKLADLTFGPAAIPVVASEVGVAAATLAGPDYSTLRYSITAGNPVYAPTPLRGLLDIQPCEQTQAADDPDTGQAPLPFWKDWKGMRWARAAGNMDVQYFYPLQTGFYLSEDYATGLGLSTTEAERVGKCVPWLDSLPEAEYPPGAQPVSYTDDEGNSQERMVYPVTYAARWPDLPALLNVGETVYQRAKSGVSAIAAQVAVSRIYDDLAHGEWNNETQQVEVGATGVVTYLTSLLDPTAEVKVELPLRIDSTPALPTHLKSSRLLFGAGLAIVGNTDDPDQDLPFALRSRILFQDQPEDLDGDEESNGVLIFRGYYDGTSPEYIKGDPLLLLNVMAPSDRERLKALCTSAADEDHDGAEDCAEFAEAIDALYWKTLNPRALDLCRDDEGRLAEGDPEPTPESNRGPQDEALSEACPSGTYRDGQPDQTFLIGIQDANDDGVPEPFEGFGKGKALTAGNAAGTGYVTLAYNNDASLGGLPVSLQVVKVQCAKNDQNEESPYRGNLLVIKSDNLFDEKLTVRHTGDFGGRPDNYQFEWWIAAVDETAVSPDVLPPSYPWQKWTRLEVGLEGLDPQYQVLGPQITIEGANPTTLRDNWVIVRYKNTRCPVCGNMVRYSAFAGDPSAKPSEVRGQLAEGWIKRVVGALNPYDARVDDFVAAPVNSNVDMIRQAGPRYEGPIAMNADPEYLNKVGLIEAYQTVLERGRALSIDSGINDQGANAALLNVTTRIAELYMLLANEAYNDALDPVVGLGTDSTLGLRAPAVYAFANQFRADRFGLIDEELALLRGRDETLGGVAAGPTYNRLTWNFTNGLGEMAYVTNYNVKDVNLDGFLNEADAAIMYPQGHGDAYGHFLTAETQYYQLLRHPDYTWVPRAEPVAVAGAPLVVDYYDEQRFAAAAAARARMAAEIVNLTYRKNYAEPTVQPYLDTHTDPSDDCDTNAAPGCNRRAWGVADWAGRAAQGAYLDWLVANAILPPEDDRYTDLRKIDRTTVGDVAAIAEQLTAVQAQLDHADNRVNPLGIADGAVLFDLDPALTKTTPTTEGQTHFEQVYDRAIASLGNTLKLFDYANQAKVAQREAQNEQQDFAADVVAQDRAIINELIEIFGYPYDADIGVNGTYPAGYDGPDIYNYNLIERTDLTDAAARCGEGQTSDCKAETATSLVEFKAMDCLGFFVSEVDPDLIADNPELLCPGGTGVQPSEPASIVVPYVVGVGLDEGRGRYLPETWSGATRKSWGDIQLKMWTVYDTRVEYETAIAAYDNHVAEIAQAARAIEDRYETLKRERKLQKDYRDTIVDINTGMIYLREVQVVADRVFSYLVWMTAGINEKCVPSVFGLANETPTKCPGHTALAILGTISQALGGVSELFVDALEMRKERLELDLNLDLFEEEADYELRQMGRELQGLIRQERELRLAMFLAADNFGGAQLDYDAAVQRGFRKLRELILLRQRWAGQITEKRYGDMAYRLIQTDALTKYRQQFDMAQLYTYMTAAAYDYETNLQTGDPASGIPLARQIVAVRSLGELRWSSGPWDVEPIVGSGGLADPLGKMRDNFQVLKGQMGFNNPQSQVSRFSLRQELFRLRDSSDASWRTMLQRYYTPDIYANPAVDKLAKKPYGMTNPQPGLVIPFTSVIRQGLNYFGLPLGPGDGAYNPTNFATKIASVGVWFEGYDINRLARMPYVYMLPAGEDVIRPRNTDGLLRYWNVTEQLLPLPYAITQADMEDPRWIPSIDGLQDRLYRIKPYGAFQAFPYSENLEPSEMNTDTRLIGRSVWNTQWLLVIPGANLLADPELGIDRFIQDVDDIYVYFQTYAYAGTIAAAADDQEGEGANTREEIKHQDAETAAIVATANAMPQPDALFYGVALRDGTPLASGTLTAVLPRGGTVTTEIAPIAGTSYNYALPVPLGFYDEGDTNYDINSARVNELVRFTIDGVPALLYDATGINYQAYPIGAAGTPYAVTVDVSGPGSYPIGDVNVSGRRDSADALLVLKFDVGLAQGVTTWPPGPGTVYLPLCDVTQDGRCNSSDALRILMCDVGLATCPSGVASALAPAGDANTVLEGANPAYFTIEQQTDEEAGEVVVQVRVESPHTPLALASLDLHYDPARLSVASCAENPAGRLDLAVCNPSYAEGTIRYVGVTAGGIVEAAALMEVRLRGEPMVLQQLVQGGAAVELTVTAALDLEGNALQPVTAGPPIGRGQNHIFVPLIIRSAGTPVGSTAPASEPTPEDPPESPASKGRNSIFVPLILRSTPASASGTAPELESGTMPTPAPAGN